MWGKNEEKSLVRSQYEERKYVLARNRVGVVWLDLGAPMEGEEIKIDPQT